MVSGTSILSYLPVWPRIGAKQVSGSGYARSTASAQRTSLDAAEMGGKLRTWVPGSAHPQNRDTPPLKVRRWLLRGQPISVDTISWV